MNGLAADYAPYVAPPGCVLGEHHVAGSKSANRAVAGFNLDLSGERNDILAARRCVEIAYMGRRRAPKEDSMGRLEFGSFKTSAQVKFNFHFFEMRFVILSGVKSDDLHQLAL
jgi:hypothetical protein